MTSFVEVAVPLGVRKTFAYSVPAHLEMGAVPGARVLVPFGRKLLTGFVVSCSNVRPSGDFAVRAIRDVLDRTPAISPALIETAMWTAEYYFAPPGEVMRSLLPAGIEITGSIRVCLSARARELLQGGLMPPGLSSKEEKVLEILLSGGPMSSRELVRQSGMSAARDWIESLVLSGWVELEEWLERPRVGAREQLGIRSIAAPSESLEKLTALQRKLFQMLDPGGKAVPLQSLLRASGPSASVARALVRQGVAEIAPIGIERRPLDLEDAPQNSPVTLTESQQRVFVALCALLVSGRAERCLLHGVTGSGKTEIYLRLIAEALRRGGSAILLVPEIGLTPLLCRIVLSRFPDLVSLLHSGISGGERFDQWQRIRGGLSRIVVGTRSAVFAPVDRLRLVIVDEEQDGSYKQDDSPCYHAREVAWHRISQSAGLMLMGSATPSIETYHAARETGSIAYLCLPERIEARPLPEVEIVDMTLEFKRKGKNAVISQALLTELHACLRRKEQAIILLNRRGYSRSLLCRSCGHVFICPDCSVSMTYHQQDGVLVCHYCGREEETPSKCAACSGEYIYFMGVGTEQLEEILRSLAPGIRLARLDRDTARRRGAVRKILFDFAAGKTDVLVGTQMLAKGHDFPKVTFVGVVAADAGLSFPDFRSAERTFQLLTQVAGRAGRGARPGRVIIQSYYPSHYALESARKQEYSFFFSREIEFRKQLGYPPYRNLVQILVTDPDREKGVRLGEQIAAAIKKCRDRTAAASGIRVLGPASAPIEKLRGNYRIQLLIKGQPGEGTIPILRQAFADLGAAKVSLKSAQVDVDPLSLI